MPSLAISSGSPSQSPETVVTPATELPRTLSADEALAALSTGEYIALGEGPGEVSIDAGLAAGPEEEALKALTDRSKPMQERFLAAKDSILALTDEQQKAVIHKALVQNIAGGDTDNNIQEMSTKAQALAILNWREVNTAVNEGMKALAPPPPSPAAPAPAVPAATPADQIAAQAAPVAAAPAAATVAEPAPQRPEVTTAAAVVTPPPAPAAAVVAAQPDSSPRQEQTPAGKPPAPALSPEAALDLEVTAKAQELSAGFLKSLPPYGSLADRFDRVNREIELFSADKDLSERQIIELKEGVTRGVLDSIMRKEHDHLASTSDSSWGHEWKTRMNVIADRMLGKEDGRALIQELATTRLDELTAGQLSVDDGQRELTKTRNFANRFQLDFKESREPGELAEIRAAAVREVERILDPRYTASPKEKLKQIDRIIDRANDGGPDAVDPARDLKEPVTVAVRGMLERARGLEEEGRTEALDEIEDLREEFDLDDDKDLDKLVLDFKVDVARSILEERVPAALTNMKYTWEETADAIREARSEARKLAGLSEREANEAVVAEIEKFVVSREPKTLADYANVSDGMDVISSRLSLSAEQRKELKEPLARKAEGNLDALIRSSLDERSGPIKERARATQAEILEVGISGEAATGAIARYAEGRFGTPSGDARALAQMKRELGDLGESFALLPQVKKGPEAVQQASATLVKLNARIDAEIEQRVAAEREARLNAARAEVLGKLEGPGSMADRIQAAREIQRQVNGKDKNLLTDEMMREIAAPVVRSLDAQSNRQSSRDANRLDDAFPGP